MRLGAGVLVSAMALALATPALARPVRVRRPPPRPVLIASDRAPAIGWSDSAVDYRGHNGARLTVTCPGFGRAGSVWGSGIFTDDSSICSAAVHAGVITLRGGGEVTIEIAPGQPKYAARTRHGIASGSWGEWSGSFVVVGGVAAPEPPPGAPRPIAWSDSATSLRGQVGALVHLICPADGSAGAVWGSGVYTDDSSICTAAVHAGVITLARGGRVDIVIRPGQEAYPASRRHGIQTQPWQRWDGSFLVLGAPAMAVDPPVEAIAR